MTNFDTRTPVLVDGLADGRSPEPRRKVFIKSFGCQMNAYDARRMADALAPSGFDEIGAAEEADLVILNTCHIRERAAEKVFSELGKLRDLKRERAAEGHPLTLAVAGCVAQAEGDEILRRQPAVDLVVGPQSYHRLPSLVAASRSAPAIDTDFPIEPKFAQLPLPTAAATRARGLSAFVTIQEGCDKFCTFCVVPYTRGAEFSRPAGEILAEVRALAAAGVREVSLLGQNVNAYHGAGQDGAAPWGLARLAAAVASVPGICRIRYTTSHPNDMDEALIAAHRDLPALMPFLHLPVQTGSDRLLAAMNRRHTAADYRDLIARVRAARPDIALSSDFIVGYPGETEDDFQATLQLIADIGFASTFFFKYSPRPGTPAARAADQIDEDIKRDRLARLQAVVEPQRHGFNAACVGRTMPVLFEKAGRHPGQVVGKSPYLQPVQVDADLSVVGQEREVLIVGLGSNSLYGRLDQPAVRSLELAS